MAKCQCDEIFDRLEQRRIELQGSIAAHVDVLAKLQRVVVRLQIDMARLAEQLPALAAGKEPTTTSKETE